MTYSLFLSCPKGLEYLLEEEVKQLGLRVTKVNPQGVYGEASLALIYQLCLWSRLANRIQLILFNGKAHNQQTLHQLCYQYPWQTVFSADKTFMVEFHGSSDQIRNTMFGAQVVKDGIVDHFRDLHQTRPTIDRDSPEVRLHAYLKQDDLTLSFDLTGYSLHQRGYRLQAGLAPLKENIAAAMLIRAKWPQLAKDGYGLQDPFCGAGTLVIEAAMMAANIAPGLIRKDQAVQHWRQHQPSLWEKLRHQALQQVKPFTLPLLGTDTDEKITAIARKNAERAGVAPLVTFKTMPVDEIKPMLSQGLLICNPPYGERLSDPTQLIPIYQQLGRVLYEHYQHWQATILTANPMLAKAMGLRSNKQYTLFNGAIECKLYCFELDPKNALKSARKEHLSEGATMFKNRLHKNIDHLEKWAKRNHIDCYRIYDADLPEYSFAIDRYLDHVVIQEYAAPAHIPIQKTEKRSLEVLQVVPDLLSIPPSHVVIKQRKRQKGTQQYQKMNQTKRTMMVHEGRAKLMVNLYDYLDTGLFLDHRPLRLTFEKLSPETKFLNCFSYTSTASVHAALAGAITTNIDLSSTYLDWSKENFKLNALDLNKHQFIQSDCLTWLKKTRDRFDVIFLDPPSFSNSKRMDDTLDIQRDHESLIRASMRLLYPGGMLYFSTNLRQFKLSPRLLEEYVILDISAETIDIDFKRNKRIHQCFLIKNQ